MEYQLLELIPTIDSHCVLLVGSSPINPNIASTYREGNLTGEKLAIRSRGGEGLTNNKSGADSLVWSQEEVYCGLWTVGGEC